MNQTVSEWVSKAEADWASANQLAQSAQPPNYDLLCFLAQQCAEKLMKALLIHHGVVPPRTHDLVALDAMICKCIPGWSFNTKDLLDLGEAAVIYRYPGNEASPAASQQALLTCKQIRAAVRPKLGLP